MFDKGKLIAGRYRILEEIDSGGTAIVYKALDEKEGEIVAIKILRSELIDNEEFVTRFKKEVHASLKLDHANIIRGYDAGLDDGTYYIVMELIEGITLKQLILEEGPLPVSYVISIAKKLCLALEYAHSKSFIHRDIKPHNVLLDKKGEPYIADFGIAKNLESNTITMEDNSVMGSVHYFSPEQARGERVDKRSDLYSLGILIYETLTGEVPFDGDSPVSIALKHLNEPMPKKLETMPNVPESLIKIVNKATQKDKHFRYKSAFSMYEDLQRALTEPNGDYIKYTESKRAHQYVNQDGNLRRTHKGVNGVFVSIGISAIVVIAVVIIFSLFLKTTAKAVEVLNVIGQDEKKAEDIITQSGLLVQKVLQDSNIAIGKVLNQTPKAGEMLAPGEIVTIYISRGTQGGIMPSVLEMPLEQAEKELADIGIKPTEIIKSSKGEYAIGSVIDQIPLPGTLITNNIPIKLTIKISPDEVKIKMPSVLNFEIEKAISILKDAGFDNLYLYEVDSDKPAGIVVEQTPAYNTEYSKGMPVSLKISKLHNTAYAFNGEIELEVPRDKTSIVIAIKDKYNTHDVFYPILESIDSSGQIIKNEFSNIYLDDNGILTSKELVIFYNGQPYKRIPIELIKVEN